MLGWFAYVWGSRIWTSAVHPPLARSNFAGISHHGAPVIALTGFAALVTAPAVEEIFFRGLLYRSLRNRLGVAPACALAAVLFAIGHTDYPLLVRPEIALFGVIAALLYEHTGSLLPGIALHSFIDGGSFEISLAGNESVVLTSFYFSQSSYCSVHRSKHCDDDSRKSPRDPRAVATGGTHSARLPRPLSPPKLGCLRVGRHIRFTRAMLDDWLAKQPGR